MPDSLEAYRGDEVFLVAVQDHGELLIDQTGAADCRASLDQFTAAMGEAGASFAHVSEVEHDSDDAPLIAQAAAAGEANLATAIARHAGPRSGLSKSGHASRTSSTTHVVTRLGGGAR